MYGNRYSFTQLLSRCSLFSLIIYTKNVSQLLLVRSGLDSHSVQICRKPTLTRERFAIFSEHYNSSCREMNVSSNKANASLFQYFSATLCAIFVEYSGLEPLTSTLPVLRSSQMS